MLKSDVQGAPSVDILLIDGGLEGYTMRWTTCPAKVVLSMGSPIAALRRMWHRHTWRLQHNQIGGVSTSVAHVYGYCPYRAVIKAWKQLIIPSRYSPPLHSVLKCTVSAGVRVQSALGFLSGQDYYDLAVRPRVCAPCVFGDMRLRSLTREELADVLDVPSGFVRAATPAQLDSFLTEPLFPLKCYSVLLMHLFVLRSGGGCDGEGVVEPKGEEDEKVDVEGEGKVEGEEDEKGDVEGNEEGKVEEDGKVEGDGKGDVEEDESNKAARTSTGESEIRNQSAVKSDGAAVPTYIWHQHLVRGLQDMASASPVALGKVSSEEFEAKASIIRDRFLLPCWRKLLLRSFISYMRCDKGVTTGTPRHWVQWNANQQKFQWTTIGHLRYRDQWQYERREAGVDIEAASDCIQRGSDASWWEWRGGSRPFFWRWSKQRLGGSGFEHEMRDGMEVLHDPDALPSYKRAQGPPKTQEDKKKVSGKLEKFMERRYIVFTVAAAVLSYISFFYVPKGADDIRVVFNGTSSMLNAATFAPWFALPTIDSHLRMVEAGTMLADADLGEMFYNFMLDVHIQPYSALDLRKYFPSLVMGGTCLFTWNRLLMGFRPSPYIATRHLLCARRFLLGDRFDKQNPFCWEEVKLNLPGTDTYDPRKPWVYKERFDGRIAGDLIIYIDDLRLSCPDMIILWEAVQQVASRLNFLGMQHAARKLRDLSCTPGPWAGSVVNTDDGVHLLTSQEKWDKTRRILLDLKSQIETGKICTADLLSWRGFLIYVSRTYHMMKPYLKGLHLTVDSWRPARGADGWKLRNADIDLLRRNNEGVEDRTVLPAEAPAWLKPVPRLAGDVDALLELCASSKPPRRRVRVEKFDSVFYVGGDASKVGYGSAMQKKTPRGEQVHTHSRIGFWTESIRDGKKSNWKELRNCVGAIEEGVTSGKLHNCEVFLFTDNTVAERAYYGGTSSDKHLFELTLRLRKIVMRGNLILHVIHIAGTRMIRMGIDGLSRGDNHEGVASGRNMVEFMDLHLSAFERSTSLKNWLWETWRSDLWGKLHELKKEEWFTHDNETSDLEAVVWTPPPAAADVCVEQLAFWRQHSPYEHVHVFICPRLFTCLWRKQLGKACDVLIEVPLPCLDRVWGTFTHFEPILIGFSFPVFNRPPYQLGLKPELMGLVDKRMSALRKDPKESHLRNLLCELWSQAKKYSVSV